MSTASRWSPATPVKGKVRYRYYISKPLQHGSADQQRGLRIPAPELEKVVAETVVAQSDNPLALTESLEAELTPALVKSISRSAHEHAQQLHKCERSIMRALVAIV